MTVLSYVLIGSLGWMAISSENRRKANVLIMVSIAHIRRKEKRKKEKVKIERKNCEKKNLYRAEHKLTLLE